MEEIPKIEFFKKNKPEIEFEIFTLDSLFSRHNKLSHSLEKPHRVSFYNIIFIKNGSGVHFIDFRPYEYNKGSILFVSEGQVHSFEINNDIEGFVILFTESFLSKNLIQSDLLSLYRLYNDILHLPVLYEEELQGDDFHYVICEIYREYYSNSIFLKEEIIRLLLKILLLKAERIKQNLTRHKKNSEPVIKFGIFKNKVIKHFNETRNAKDYAKMVNISYKSLNEICKTITGSTAKVFIDHFVTLEIKRRLATTDASIKELTYQLGFDEPTNLVKFFKKNTRQTPSQFKQMISK